VFSEGVGSKKGGGWALEGGSKERAQEVDLRRMGGSN